MRSCPASADIMTGPKIAVLGIGNPLRRDDGLGIRVVQIMQSNPCYVGVDIIDGGTAPDLFSLLDESVGKLVIVDVLRGKGEPGSIYRLEITEENISAQPSASLHGLGVLDSLQLMVRLGMRPPEVIIIGVEPYDVANGLGLSPQMESLVPQVISEVEKELGGPH